MGVAVVSLVAAVAVFAVGFLTGSNLDAASRVPAGAVAYAEFTVDPGGEQKVAAAQLLNRLTDDADYTVDEDPAEAQRDGAQFVLDAFCRSIDYEDDVEPWLGSTVAVALLDDDGGTPVLIVQTEGEEASADGLEDLYDCAFDYFEEYGYVLESALPDLVEQIDRDLGVAYDGSWAVVGPNQKVAEDTIEAAKDAALADEPEFESAMEDLGGLGFATAWASGERAADLAGPYSTRDTQDGLADLFTTTAATLRVEGDVIEVAGTIIGDEIEEIPTGDFTAADLPGDSIQASYWGGIGTSLGASMMLDYSDGFGYSERLFGISGYEIGALLSAADLDTTFPIGYFDDLGAADDDTYVALATNTPEYPSADVEDPVSDADCAVEEVGRGVWTNLEKLFYEGPGLKGVLVEEESTGELDWDALYESYLYEDWLDDSSYLDSFEDYVYDYADPEDWSLVESFSYCDTEEVDPTTVGTSTVWTDDEAWASGASRLGENSEFQSVIPSAEEADVVVFAGRDLIAHEAGEFADVVVAAGYSLTQKSGSATFTARVLIAN